MQFDAVIVGAGPAGLMAAETMAAKGAKVAVCDAMPSVGRKFLMAGKSGLNLTKSEPLATFLAAFRGPDLIRDIVATYHNKTVEDWARGLGQDVFTGSSGRVFPTAMKASPLLRAWLTRLDAMGVQRFTRHRLVALKPDSAEFDTPDGAVTISAKAIVLALGGASWARLGSDAKWVEILERLGARVMPFRPSNMGFNVHWSTHMEPVFGDPVKPAILRAGDQKLQGEFVVSKTGVEGSAIYAVSAAVRDGAALSIDLLPNMNQREIQNALRAPRGKNSVSNFLRKRLKLSRVKIALLNEICRPFPADLSKLPFKSLELPIAGSRPIDEAISTAGGVDWASLDDDLRIKGANVFCAGEMLDWDAPTGGYLLTGCFATGRHAGAAALKLLNS